MAPTRAAATRAATSLAELSDSDSGVLPSTSPYKPAKSRRRSTKPNATCNGKKNAPASSRGEVPASGLVSGQRSMTETAKHGRAKPVSTRSVASVLAQREPTIEVDSAGSSVLTELSDDPDTTPARKHTQSTRKTGPTRTSRTRSPSPLPSVSHSTTGFLFRSSSSLLNALKAEATIPTRSAKRLLHSEEDTEEDEELPSTISRTVDRTAEIRPTRPPRKKQAVSLTTSVLRDTGPDGSLSIPGEKVLAIWRDNKYWPATLHSYIPSHGPKGDGKYRVVFFDAAQDNLRRDQFKVYPDDGDFATCELGDIVSRRYQDTSGDERHLQEPEPVFPLPREFHISSMRVQFAYIKPVINAILNGRYPASDFHTQFFQGQNSRRNVMQRQHLHGILGSDVAEALGKYLRRWLLGDDFTKPRDVFDDDNDVVNLTKSAPKGLLDSRDQQLESVLDSTESSGFTPLQLTATPSDNGASQHQIPIPNIEVSSPSSDCMIVVSDSVASITAPSSANIDICDNTDTSLPPPSSSPAISQTVSSEGSEGNEYETNISSSHHVLDHVAVSMRAISASTSIDTPAPVAHETPAPWVVDMSDVTTTQAEQERNPVMARDVSSTSSHDLYINGHGVVDPSVNVQNDTGAGGLPRGCPAYESLGDLERLHYCENVLRPEAIYQLLLWYKGERTTAQVQDDAEETRLRARGIELSEEPDLVSELLAWRKEERRKRGLPADGVKPRPGEGGERYSSSGRAIRQRRL